MLLLTCVTFFGAIAKGLTTLGLALVAIPPLAAIFGVESAILTLFVAKCTSDLYMFQKARTAALWGSLHRLRWFIACGGIGVATATLLLAGLEERFLSIFLGAFVVTVVVWQSIGRRLRISTLGERYLSPAMGALSGLCQGLTGAGGPPMAVYLRGLALQPRDFVAVSCALYLSLDLGQAISIVALGLYDGRLLVYALLVVVPVLLGTWVGVRLRGKLSTRGFDRALAVVLFSTGVILLWKGLVD